MYVCMRECVCVFMFSSPSVQIIQLQNKKARRINVEELIFSVGTAGQKSTFISVNLLGVWFNFIENFQH